MAAPTSSPFHVPVLLGSVLDLAEGAGRAVDATLGDGGHSVALLERGVEILGIDRDPQAIARARERLGGRRIRFLHTPYDSPEALTAISGFRPNLILLDLGVSSRQLDQMERGFTFRPGARLDMRMDPTGPSAADVLNRHDETALERVFADYGDERQARKLAREIVRRRQRQPFTISDDLVNAVRATLGARAGPSDFARLFQAVRIEVNEELSGLERSLPSMRDALTPGGKLAIITYHSGEDRLVKLAFREWARACVCPPRQPVCTCRGHPLGRVEPRKPILPNAAEIEANPRARSAKLRVFRVGNAA